MESRRWLNWPQEGYKTIHHSLPAVLPLHITISCPAASRTFLPPFPPFPPASPSSMMAVCLHHYDLQPPLHSRLAYTAAAARFVHLHQAPVRPCYRRETASTLQEGERPLADSVVEGSQATVKHHAQGVTEEQVGSQVSWDRLHIAGSPSSTLGSDWAAVSRCTVLAGVPTVGAQRTEDSEVHLGTTPTYCYGAYWEAR